MWFTILGIGFVIACYVALSRRSQERTPDSLSSPPKLEAASLSVEQARAEVEGLIAKGEKLFVAPEDEPTPPMNQLGPVTREFFSRYSTLRSRRGGFELSAADIRASEYVHGFLSIGHSEDWDVVQRMGSDEVFVVEGAETREAEMQPCFPSIYHLILDEASQV